MNTEKAQNLRKLVLTALFMALACVATMVIHIPSPMEGGYLNLGDCIVLLAGWVLGPWWGMAAGGIGSGLADIFLGSAAWAPGTLVIKALMGMTAGLIAKHAGLVRRILSGVAAEVIMVLGYFAYSGLVMGYGLAATAEIPGNLIQGGVGLVVAVLLFVLLDKTGTFKHLKKAGIDV